MKERFQNLEPGDIILTTWEETRQTVPYFFAEIYFQKT